MKCALQLDALLAALELGDEPRADSRKVSELGLRQTLALSGAPERGSEVASCAGCLSMSSHSSR